MFSYFFQKYSGILVLLLLCCVFIIPQYSYAKPCEEGISKCRKYDGGNKYKKCMKIVCSDSKNQSEKKEKSTASEKINESEGFITGIEVGDVQVPNKLSKDKTCKIGLHKCNSLRDESKYYWRCMKDTCASSTGYEEPSCDEGHRKCKFRLDSYWICMGLTCKTSVTSFETCEKGVDVCAPDLNKYWNCVSEICLGDVKKYRNPDPNADREDYDEKNPSASKYILKGVPDKYKYAPKGVDPLEWVSITPPARTMRGPPSRTLRCLARTSSIACSDSSDILTCVCSDGSRPETKPAYKRRNFKQNQ